MNGNGSACTTSFLLGAVIGAAVGLLYAPRAGSETRKMLAKKSKHLKDTAENVYQETRETARNFITEAKDLAKGRT